MDTPLVVGRWIAEMDSLDAAKVVVVDEAFVRPFWPRQPLLGERTYGSLRPLA